MREPGQGEREPEWLDRSGRGERPSPVPAPSRTQQHPAARGGPGAGAMARLGDREPSTSVLERLLANAALRDEAGRLREPQASPPEGVSQGVWGVGGVHGVLGLAPLPVAEAVPPVSSRNIRQGLQGLPGKGQAEGTFHREDGLGASEGVSGARGRVGLFLVQGLGVLSTPNRSVPLSHHSTRQPFSGG